MAIWYVDIYNGHDRNTVTNAVASNPSGSTVLITFPTTGLEHEYITGMQVTLSLFTAWLNGTWTITVIDDYSFTLDGAVWQATADATGTCAAAVGHQGGDSWATAWKTLTYGASAIRIQPGDEIRISKTPDPISIGYGTWNLNTKNVTLESARTENIFSGDGQWIVSQYVTSTRTTMSSYYRYGSGIYSIAIASSFTTGKAAYYTLPSTLNLSAYQQLSFWLKPSTNITANWRVCLCSDSIGNDIVDEFNMEYQAGYNYRAVLATKVGGGNLGSSINSIAIYIDSEPGTPTIYLNNIIATKINDINHSALISRCGTARGGQDVYDGFFPILCIDGTNVAIDNYVTVTSGNLRFDPFWYDTVECYIRIPYLVPQKRTNILAPTKAGLLGSETAYKGGYEIGTEIQNGYTYISIVNSVGNGISISNMQHISFNGISVSRANIAALMQSSYEVQVEFINNCGNLSHGVSITNCANSIINVYNSNCNGGSGIYISLSGDNCFEYISSYHNGGTGGLDINNSNYNKFKNVLLTGTNMNVVVAGSHGNIMKVSMVTNGKVIGWGVKCDNSIITLYDSVFNYSIYNMNWGTNIMMFMQQIRFINSYLDGELYARRVEGKYFSAYYDHGDLNAPRTGDSHYWFFNLQWRFTIKSQFKFKIAEFAFVANKLITITAWVKQVQPLTICRTRISLQENLVYGIEEIYCENTMYGHNTWEQLTLTFTPTVDGISELYINAYTITGSAYQSVTVGSISITQAD